MRVIDGKIYFTLPEVALACGVTFRTVQRWRFEPHRRPKHAPDMKVLQFPGGKCYVCIDDIRAVYERAIRKPVSNEAILKFIEDTTQSNH